MRKNLHHKIMLSILAGSLALGFVYAPPAFAVDVLIADTSYTAPDGTPGTYDLDAEGTTAGTNYGDAEGYKPITLPTDDIDTFTVTAGNGGRAEKNGSTGGKGGSISLSAIGNAINNGISVTAGSGGDIITNDEFVIITSGSGGDVKLTFNNAVTGGVTATSGSGGDFINEKEQNTLINGNGGNVELTFDGAVTDGVTATGGNGGNIIQTLDDFYEITSGSGGDVTLTFNNTVSGGVTATGGNSGNAKSIRGTLSGGNGGNVNLTFMGAVTGDIIAKAGNVGDAEFNNVGFYSNFFGGDVNLTFGGTVRGDIKATAGNGTDLTATRMENFNGGNGGNVELTFKDAVTGDITATAGNGGSLNLEYITTFSGNNGGNVNLTFMGAVTGDITATAGNSGKSEITDGVQNFNGNNGGDVTLTFNNNVVTDSISLTGGINTEGAHSDSKGGSVNFTANSISGKTSADSSDNTTTSNIDINLTKNDGDITFDVGTLNIDDNTVKITAKDSTGNTNNVDIGKTRDNHIENLILTGNGDIDTTDANVIKIGSLTINDGTVNDTNWAGFIDRTYYNDDGVTENNNIALGENGVTFDIASNKTLAKNLTGSNPGNLTKTGAGTLKLTGSTYDYTGLTVVEQGTLDASASALTASKGLTLLGGATFVANNSQDWNEKQFVVYDNGSDNSATYQGNLNAQNSNLYFIASGDNTNPLLSVTGSADISGSKYNIGFTGKTTFDEGQTLTLIEADGTIDASGLQQGNGIDGIDDIKIGSTITQSITDVTTVPEVASNGSKLIATLGSTLATDEASVLNASMLGGLAFNLQGADLIAREGMEAAVRSAQLDNNHAVFAALTRSSLDYGAVDVDGTNMLAGLAWRSTTGAGSLTYGVFAEHGDGSYDTYANINGTSLHGEGDTDYTGGGILARMDFNGSENGHGYLEASGRVGNADTDYTNSGLRDAYGRAASYSTDGTYYGAHIGAGYVQKLDEKSSIDWYGKLLWARLEGGSADLSTGEHLTFDDADSLRLRIGGRWNYAASDFVSYYAGLGYEYEFDGEASGFTNGLALGDEDLTGGSGVAELGISFKPSKNSPFSLELNLAGFTGEREGFRGGVEAVYTF